MHHPGGVAGASRRPSCRLLARRSAGVVGEAVSPGHQTVAKTALRPNFVRVFGKLQPREDIDYTYSDSQEVVVRIPISYPKDKTADYDYYFLSDSGRFGGPYFEPSPSPIGPSAPSGPGGIRRPLVREPFFRQAPGVAGPEGTAPALGGGARPAPLVPVLPEQRRRTGKLTASHRLRSLSGLSRRINSFPPSLSSDLAQRTGEKVDLLPFTDLLDANQIVLASAPSQALKDLAAAKRHPD